MIDSDGEHILVADKKSHHQRYPVFVFHKVKVSSECKIYLIIVDFFLLAYLLANNSKVNKVFYKYITLLL